MLNAKPGKTILILGAGSDMAIPLIRLLYQQWQAARFYLLGRNTTTLQPLAMEGRAKGHTVEVFHYDTEISSVQHFSGVEICITYVGWLPDNNDEPQKAMLLNCTGIETFVNQLVLDNKEALQQIMITGSIAGVRVRSANRAYGLAKAALHQYTLQLQQKWKSKIAVTLVIPGYVQTKMLGGLKTPSPLTLSPEALAGKYVSWLETKPVVAYSQPVWKGIGMILKILPQFVVNKMK